MDPIIIFPDPSQCQSCHQNQGGLKAITAVHGGLKTTTAVQGVCTRSKTHSTPMSMASGIPLGIALAVTLVLRRYK